MTPAESLVVVQRRFLDVMHERDAALALLRDCRNESLLFGGFTEAIKARLDALLAKDGTK